MCYRRKTDLIRTNLLNIQSTTTVSSSDYEKFLTAGSTNWSTIKTQLHVTSIVHVREYFWNNDNDNNDNDKVIRLIIIVIIIIIITIKTIKFTNVIGYHKPQFGH